MMLLRPTDDDDSTRMEKLVAAAKNEKMQGNFRRGIRWGRGLEPANHTPSRNGGHPCLRGD